MLSNGITGTDQPATSLRKGGNFSRQMADKQLRLRQTKFSDCCPPCPTPIFLPTYRRAKPCGSGDVRRRGTSGWSCAWFSGFGAALIFIPLASAIVGPRIASAVLLVVDGVLTLGMIPAAWRMADRREVFTMSAGAVIGVPAGTALLSYGNPLTLRWLISCVVVLLLLFLISGWRYSGRPKTP